MSEREAGAPSASRTAASSGPSGSADASGPSGSADGPSARSGAGTGDAAARWQAALLPNYGTPGLCLVEGQGAYVTDDQGDTYLDLVAGIAVSALGHAHPNVVAAVREQAGRLMHTSNLYAHPKAIELAERLQRLSGGHKALFVNSGTEANEAAYKLMRRRARLQDRDAVIVAFEGSFHGRTTGGLALTGQPKHRETFDVPGGIVHVPFNDPAALEAAFEQHDVCGVFAEVVQGEGGVVPMDKETARALARLTAPDDVLLCIDEVQTGIGRTGAMFAHTPLGLDPDLITLAKGLGGGMPIGALLARPAIADVLGAGTHGCTFGGNPVCAAAALAVLDTLEAEDLVVRAGQLGAKALDMLHAAGIEARGQGLLLGIPGDAKDVARQLQDQGVLVGVAGPGVVRLAPPLVVPEQAFLDAVQRLIACLRPVPAK